MVQLELDATPGAVWDVVRTGTPQQLSLIRDVDYVAQKAKQIYLTNLSEVFTDKDYGIPWFGDILGKRNTELGGVRALFEETITQNSTMIALGVTGCKVGNVVLNSDRRLLVENLVITVGDSEDVQLGSISV